MNKYLILEFKNAGLFRTNKKTKDKIFWLDKNKYNRYVEDEFDEPITVHQITNVLHTLFGERPVPKNRPVGYNLLNHYQEMASNSFLKIDNFKDGKNCFVSEITQLNKSAWDAKADTVMNWELTRRLLDEHYQLFMEMVKEVFNHTPKTITFNKLCNLIKKSKDRRVGEVFDFLKSKGKTSFYNYVFIGNKSEVSANDRIRLTITKGIDKKTNFDGSIIVPVNDDDIIKLKKSKGCATLLDGGAIFIKGIKYDGVNTNGYIPVKEISLEKRKQFKKETNENQD
jgi:hypothetical protein